jgi:hypothetical protein
MPKKKVTASTFLIHTPGVHHKMAVERAVDELERDGWSVYWPDRDNEVTGDDGLEANLENRRQMLAADFVHIMWDGKSSGFLFGLGMAFALEKHIKVISIPEPTKWRSFQNLIYRWRNSHF